MTLRQRTLSKAQRNATRAAFALLLAAGVACQSEEASPAAAEPTASNATPPEDAPRLVLMVAVDQMRADYLTRFRPLLSEGLDRLLTSGAVFTDNHHGHAHTETSPGHATLATGMHPKSHGIVRNSWYERTEKREVYSVEDDELGRSPHRLASPTLGDLLKARYPSSKVFGIGGKDRAAILTAGHHADAALWFDRVSGGFTTSDYYPRRADLEEGWLGEFNSLALLDAKFGMTWDYGFELEDVAEYGIEPLDRGAFTRKAPYALGRTSLRPDASFYGAIYNSPLIDDHVTALAKAIVEGEGLGDDEYPDVLAVNYSALDSIGHGFGPDSPEMLATLLNVDRTLGELLDFLDQRIGLENVIVTLSSDHGVGVVPELQQRRTGRGGRFGRPQTLCFQRMGQEMAARFGDADWFEATLHLDAAVIEEQSANRLEIEDFVSEQLGACELFAEVVPVDRLDPENEIHRLYLNNQFDGRMRDFAMILEPDVLTSSTTASHGSPHPYDTHVPWLLWLPRVEAQTVTTRTQTVDHAATLAPLLGVEAEFDGVDRRGELQ